jgi:DsbC/DsbD-like thiol-disulfide interchange protein
VSEFRSVWALGLCALLTGLRAYAAAAVVETPQTRAELSAERGAVAPGESLWVALSIVLKPEWHTYWRTPGDAGEPIAIKWKLPPGVVAGPIQWPTPERFTFSDIAGFGYTDHVTLLTEMKVAPAIAAPSKILLEAESTWLVCSEICVPEDGSFSLPIRIDAVHRSSVANAAFIAARKAMPSPAPWPIKAVAAGNTLIITAGPGIGQRALKGVLYFPYDGSLIVNAAKQDFHLQDGTLELKVPLMPDAPSRSEAAGVLRFDRGNGAMPGGYTFRVPILSDSGT